MDRYRNLLRRLAGGFVLCLLACCVVGCISVDKRMADAALRTRATTYKDALDSAIFTNQWPVRGEDGAINGWRGLADGEAERMLRQDRAFLDAMIKAGGDE